MSTIPGGRLRAALVTIAALGLAVGAASPALADTTPPPPAPIDLANAEQLCSTDSSAPMFLWTQEGLQVEAVTQDTNSADATSLSEQFQLWPVSDPTQVTTATTTYVDPGFEASATFPAADLADGQTYAWQVQAIGTGGSSAWSGPCYVTVQNTAPPVAPTVASANYPSGQHDQPGAPVQLTFGAGGAGDVAGYVFSWSEPLPVAVTSTGAYGIPLPVDTFDVTQGVTFTGTAGFVQASSVGGAATVDLIPPQDTGYLTLTVASLNQALSQSPATTYTIETNSDVPTLTLKGSLPSFGKPTVLKFSPGAGLEAASPVTSYKVQISDDSGQQTVSVPASSKGKAQFTFTDESPDIYFVSVTSVSADGWVSQQQSYGVTTAPTIDSTDYPQDDTSGGVGVPGTFTITPSVKGIASYTYSVNGGPATTIKADGTDPVQLIWTPTASGWYDLNVYGTAKDGTQLTANDYYFAVN